MVQSYLFDCNDLIVNSISSFINYTIGAFPNFANAVVALDLVASRTVNDHCNG